MGDPEVQAILLDASDEFRSLAAQHAELEARLEELSSNPVATEQERIEEIEIKKHKLLVKDQMAAMMRDYRRDKLAAVAH